MIGDGWSGNEERKGGGWVDFKLEYFRGQPPPTIMMKRLLQGDPRKTVVPGEEAQTRPTCPTEKIKESFS